MSTTSAGPRPKRWGHDAKPETHAAVIRGVYANALEKSFTRGELGRVLRASVGPARALEVYHAVAVALFPEDYAVPGEGLVPKSGGRRVGPERLRAFVEHLLSGRNGDGRA